MASHQFEMKESKLKKIREAEEGANEIAKVHGVKPKVMHPRASTKTSSGSTSYHAEKTTLKSSLSDAKLLSPLHTIDTISETSCSDGECVSETERETLLASKRKNDQSLFSNLSRLSPPIDAHHDSEATIEKFSHAFDELYAGKTSSQRLNLEHELLALESDGTYSVSTASAKSSTSNLHQVTPSLEASRKLQVDSHFSTLKVPSCSDTDESDAGPRCNEPESKRNLSPKETLFKTGTPTRRESSHKAPWISKEYFKDTQADIQESETESLLKKKSVSQALSLQEKQQIKRKRKLKRSASVLPGIRVPRGPRRRSDVTPPTIKIDGVADELEDGHAPKRKQSLSFFGKLLSSPKSSKRKGQEKSRSTDLLDASELGKSSASDPNLLDAEKCREEKFKDSAGTELREFYSKFSLSMPSAWMKKNLKICDIFVEPILSFNRKEVPLEKLFVVKPNRSSINPLIVIKGQPGSGKTALCQYLVHCWCQNETRIPDLESIDLLFMIECRFATTSLLTSLRTIYLRKSISHIPQAETDDEYFLGVLDKFRTLIILDGFDEIQDSSRSLLKDIKTELPDAKIIVSTRLSGIRDIQETLDLDISYDAVEILLKLFTEEQLVSLVMNISHIYGVCDEKQYELLDHIDDNKLFSVLKVPLYLILYLMLWIHEPDIYNNIKTVIDIFDGVIGFMCNQLSSSSKDGSSTTLLRKQTIQRWLIEVGHVCLQCIQARQFYFGHSEYTSLTPHSNACSIDHENAFKLIMQEVPYLPGRHLRTFCHVTVMEHFAATYMDYNIHDNHAGIFETLAPSRNASNVPANCWKSCVATASTPTDKVTNSGTRNYQLDSAISHLAQISCKNDHNTFKMGKELATYFSLNNNRNLVTLSNIISLLEKRDDPFKHGLRKGLANQHLPDQIHVWNLKHVIKIIEYGALKPSVQVKFSVENSKDWGKIVNKLVDLGCKPYINVVIENAEQMEALLYALRVIKEPTVPKLILHFGFIDIGIHDLAENWPYPKTMHIVSPKGKYAIESYVACLLLVMALKGKRQVKHIRFTGHESSYIFGLLKKSLKDVSIQLQPYAQDYVQFEIFMKTENKNKSSENT